MSEKKQEEKKMRQIVIETDGNIVQIKKIEVAGFYELVAILDNVKNYFQEQIKK